MGHDQQELAGIVETIIDANVYMVLGTADEGGRPWVSPVFFSHAGYTEFYWVSNPGVNHSQNLKARSELSIVIFDSQVAPGSGQAVYMSALAGEVTDDLEAALGIYSDGPSGEEPGAGNSEGSYLLPSTACIERPFPSIRSCAHGRRANPVPSTGELTTIGSS